VGNPNPAVGEPEREEKVATPAGTEPNYPIALLVSGSSASASEIVAGAMKNHDRAVLIGETTFGKGSVQLVFSDLPDKAALKLTIAQYLTEPGDISIQGTGVTPDIQLDPMTADLQEMDLTVDTGMVKERDLSRSLSNARTREGQKPSEVLRYNLPSKERQELRERGGDPDDNFQMEFPIRFARDLVSRVPQGKRLDQVRAAKQLVAEVRAQEVQKLAQDLQAIGIDWSDVPANEATTPAGPPAVEVKVETDRPNNEVTAGEPMVLKLTLTNKGTAPLYRLNAITKSDNGLFDNKELVIGKLEPGKSKTASIPLGWCDTEGKKVGSTVPLPKDAPRTCRIPRDTHTRSDVITLKFDEARGRAPQSTSTRVSVRALERPVFAYSYQVVDNRKGNGDGRVQKGEGFTMYVSIRNVGKGRAYETQANLKNLSGDGVLLHEGRYDISNLAPGEQRKISFTFDVESQLADSEAKVELSISDRDLRETVIEKVRMPITSPVALSQHAGTMKAKATGAQLVESPQGRVFGRLPAGVAARVDAAAGEYVRLALGDNRFGFALRAELEDGGAPAAVAPIEDALQRLLPTIELGQVPLAVRDNHLVLKGTANDTERLLDGYVFVGNKKVFYRSNRAGANPKQMAIEADLPLRPGVNVVTVFARETPDTVARKMFIVRRDGPNGEALQTPKTEEDEAAGGGGADD
jgi:carboxyl-terminal processing protease